MGASAYQNKLNELLMHLYNLSIETLIAKKYKTSLPSFYNLLKKVCLIIVSENLGFKDYDPDRTRYCWVCVLMILYSIFIIVWKANSV